MSRRHLRLREALVWRVFQIGVAAAGLLPDILEAVVPLAGELAFWLNRSGRTAVLANLAVAMPGASFACRQREARAVFRSVSRYYVEMLTLPRTPAGELERRTSVVGYEHFLAAQTEGKGVIVASIHAGPAEITLQAFAARGVTYTAMVEELRPQQLAELVLRLREAHGHRYVYPTVAGTRALLRTLRAGGTVALLVDRDVLGSGLPVTFLGRTLHAPPGAVELASVTGAPIVPGFARRLGCGRYHVTLLPPLHVPRRLRGAQEKRAEVERLLAQFEPFVRRYPGQWLVLQPLWRRAER